MPLTALPIAFGAMAFPFYLASSVTLTATLYFVINGVAGAVATKSITARGRQVVVKNTILSRAPKPTLTSNAISVPVLLKTTVHAESLGLDWTASLDTSAMSGYPNPSPVVPTSGTVTSGDVAQGYFETTLMVDNGYTDLKFVVDFSGGVEPQLSADTMLTDVMYTEPAITFPQFIGQGGHISQAQFEALTTVNAGGYTWKLMDIQIDLTQLGLIPFDAPTGDGWQLLLYCEDNSLFPDSFSAVDAGSHNVTAADIEAGQITITAFPVRILNNILNLAGRFVRQAPDGNIYQSPDGFGTTLIIDP